ncbi:hypothetical protein BDF14DRAFT_1747172 [Spinellus fusiger]|nr:hypothetical protein BDF14DRAFT_1747172 [Spinellus fusiger]
MHPCPPMLSLVLFLSVVGCVVGDPTQWVLGSVSDTVSDTVSAHMIPPYTTAWVHVLEQFYNTLSYVNGSQPEEECLHKIPEFTCEPFYWEDSIIDRDAYHLRPEDIKSVIALGDSITAGFGMVSGRPPFASVWEHRGKAFSAGGDLGEHTLTQFLSHYTVPLGAPEGVTVPLARGRRLNNAVTGAKAQDLDSQVTRLTRLLKTSNYASLKDEWKVITLFVGANNICLLCTEPITRLPHLADADVFESHVRDVVERLRTEVGKSFVNLVGLFNVSSVYEASKGDAYCEFILDPSHLSVCSCIQGNDEQRHAADLVVAEYNVRLEKIATEFRLRNDSQFAVVYQPAFTYFPVGDFQQHYLSGFDCFHPNRCANQVMATVLWNNMFSTPAEKKQSFVIEDLTFQCPGPHRPYLQ